MTISTENPKTYLGTFSTLERSLDSIRPSPENDKLYRPVTAYDHEVQALAASIRAHGVKEPLVISEDGFVLSGHRRRMAAILAGLKTVPCRVEPITSKDPEFVEMLREYNRQRIKTLAEIAREEIVSADPEEAYESLLKHRQQKAAVDLSDAIAIEGKKSRSKISKAKRPFLDAIIAILNDREDFWPLSVRQIHYYLLNEPPLIHASKPKSVYANCMTSYKAAIDICGRGRLTGEIPWDAVDDETRPVTLWSVHDTIAPFMREQLEDFMQGYWRNLLQSQPNHIELIGEKNTIASVIRPVASEYTIPMTIGRGYSSLPPRYKMAQRFKRSGKEQLILLIVSDFDPEGEDIAHSFARSMRDDFGIKKIVPKKVALTKEQVEELKPKPNNLDAKKNGSRHKKFTKLHGDSGYELEAIPPENLQDILRIAIDSVLDVKAFNAEIDAEKQDAAHLEGIHRVMQTQMASVDLGK